MCTGTVQDIIYIIGGGPGFVPVSTVEAYDPPADTIGGTPWVQEPNMPNPTHRLAAAVIGDLIYICGGWYGMGVKSWTFSYDPINNIWVQLADMPDVRQYHAAASYGGKLYVFGGAGPENTCFEYDPSSGSWDIREPMPLPRYGLAAVTVGDRIFVIGGDNGMGVVGKVEEYIPLTNIWITRTEMPTPRSFLTCCVRGDTIYAIGGVDDAKAYHSTVEKYIPSTDTWVPETPMPTPRRAPVSSVVNGIIYVIGGDDGSALGTNEAAEPATAMELTSFNAIGQRGGVAITWSTALEEGIVQWIIERSTRGSSEVIATIDGKLQSPTPSTYCYFDTSVMPKIRYQYKLGARAKDQSLRWYGPVSATSMVTDMVSLFIAPNPFRMKAEIRLVGEWENGRKGEAKINIYDLSGRLVRNVPVPSPCSLFPAVVTLDAEGMAPGIYFARLVTDTGIPLTIKKITLIK
jgi:hypothetical protein